MKESDFVEEKIIHINQCEVCDIVSQYIFNMQTVLVPPVGTYTFDEAFYLCEDCIEMVPEDIANQFLNEGPGEISKEKYLKLFLDLLKG